MLSSWQYLAECDMFRDILPEWFLWDRAGSSPPSLLEFDTAVNGIEDVWKFLDLSVEITYFFLKILTIIIIEKTLFNSNLLILTRKKIFKSKYYPSAPHPTWNNLFFLKIFTIII